MKKTSSPIIWDFPDYPEIDDDYKQYFRSLDKRSLLALTDDSNWTDRTRLYAWCRKPVLVLYGADEPESEKKDMRDKGLYAAKATVVEIPGCDHIGLLVAGATLAPTAHEFLTGNKK
jgi:pimeloyl-ACP methyl ester carboxylesterase